MQIGRIKSKASRRFVIVTLALLWAALRLLDGAVTIWNETWEGTAYGWTQFRREWKRDTATFWKHLPEIW